MPVNHDFHAGRGGQQWDVVFLVHFENKREAYIGKQEGGKEKQDGILKIRIQQKRAGFVSIPLRLRFR